MQLSVHCAFPPLTLNPSPHCGEREMREGRSGFALLWLQAGALRFGTNRAPSERQLP